MYDPSLTPELLESYLQQMAACREWLQRYDQNQHTIAQLTGVLELYINAHLMYYTNLPGAPREKQVRAMNLEKKLNTILFRRTRDIRSTLAGSQDKLSLIHSEIARYDHAFVYYLNGIYYNLLPNRESFVEVVILQFIGMLGEKGEPYFDKILDDENNFVNPPTGEGLFYFFADVMYLGWLRRTEGELAKWNEAIDSNRSKRVPEPVVKRGNQQIIESFEQMFWEPKDAEITIRIMNRLHLLEKDESFIDVKNNKKALAILLDFLTKRENQKLRPITDIVKSRLLSERFKFSISERALRSLYKDSEVILSEIERLWREESVKVAS